MKQAVRLYIAAIVAATCVAVAFLAQIAPDISTGEFYAVLTLSAIALVAHATGHTVSSRTGGAVSFVPFLASVAVSPNWLAAVGVMLVSLIAQIVRRRPLSKGVFNTFQHGLSVAIATLLYRWSGGSSVLAGGPFPYVAIVVLFITYSAINSTSVSGVVAVSDGRRFTEVWAESCLGTMAYDLFALPAVAALAWVYTRYGTPGAFLFAISLLGLRELYKVNIELDKANQELLELMVAAIEARDPYTSGHSRRVAEHAKVISQILGLRASAAKRVQVAALLHDVGKIHEVFAPILQKPGRLTDEENAIMQTHPIKSEELIAKVSQLGDVVSPIRHHHENWDGTGYPDGLAGESIPLASRIIMFADTIDAMTSDRPYRKAMNADAVRAELIKHRGHQFDPSICDALLSSPRYNDLFKNEGHISLPHTQEVPKLRIARPVV